MTDIRSPSSRMRWQADWCDRLGSPLYGDLLRHSADDADAGGPVARALAGHENDPIESMLQLRFMGAMHRLALARESAGPGRRLPVLRRARRPGAGVAGLPPHGP